MSVANYQSGLNWANLETLEGKEGQVYVKIYNNTGAALSNGAIKVLAYYVDATTTTTPFIKGIPVAPATNADACNVILVVDNSVKGLATIADATYGWACVSGYTTARCDGGTTDIAVGDGLEVLNGATVFTVKTQAAAGVGIIQSATVAAIAMEAYTSGTAALKKVCLVGRPVVIAAS